MDKVTQFDSVIDSHKLRYFSLGRHALLIALDVLQLKKGDVALVPGFICRDLLASFHTKGVVPVFYEVNKEMEPVSLPVIKGVRAVLAVNYFGFPQNLTPFRKYCNENSAALIEDNAHGFLSCDETGSLLGSRGDIGFFSIRKTIPLPDGAMLMVNQEKLLTYLPDQLNYRKENLPLGFRIKKVFSVFERKTGIRFLAIGRNLARFIRKLSTGHAIIPLAPENEFEIPMELAPHYYLKQQLPKINLKNEILRRRRLYEKVDKVFESINIKSVFKELPENVVPYVYPFYAEDSSVEKAVKLARDMGLDCTYWPDLPLEIESKSPVHYRSLLIVHFIC